MTEAIVNCCEAQKITPCTNTIVLNGYKHEVTKNVYDILLRRSSLLRNTTIWIDSLCINQKDKIEKNHQVPMMKTIYQNASHVFVCLGENRNAWLAMAMLNDLVLTNMMVSPENFAAYVQSLYAARLVGNSVSLAARTEAFYELLANPWFTRVWVFQEVVFAKSITIMYGNCRIIWEYFGALEMIFTDPRYHELIAAFTYTGETFVDRRFTGLHQFSIMDRMRRHRIKVGTFFNGVPLVKLLAHTSIYEATESVDKIFAVLTCARGFDSGLKGLIDYTLTLEQTLLRVANYMVNQGDLMETLHLAGIGWSEGRDRPSIPSWVVDVCIPVLNTSVIGNH